MSTIVRTPVLTASVSSAATRIRTPIGGRQQTLGRHRTNQSRDSAQEEALLDG